MRLIVAGHEATTASEFAELAIGIDTELFTGTAGESAISRRARLAVAHAKLADLTPTQAVHARRLLRTAARRRLQSWKAAA
ncbi:hypothetical protein ACFW1A_15940 [Kitasatospora sp. NPDC058965]|uniref:hypothetical protein n=1 Tax=Kitasatospora sp. NPDC058965 TaxID=3346682 RepID=UPI0036995850